MSHKEGLIYHYSWNRKSGEVEVPGKAAFNRNYRFINLFGSALIVAGLAGLVFTFQPVVSSELHYAWYQAFGNPTEEQRIRAQALAQARAEAEERRKEQVRKLAAEVGLENTRFSLYIPKIKAKAPVEENVNAVDPRVYMPALQRGVAHAAGSVFPGMQGATFLFAHSTDAPWNVAQYNAVFYLLRELEPGNEVYVFFLDKIHKYRVREKHIIEPEDVSWLTRAREGKERLILQTCWPPGTTLKRLIVVAEPAE